MNRLFKITAIVLAAAAVSACMPNYSNGTRVGTVTKLSEKGVVFKSWQGQMTLGGTVNSESGVVANTFEFNADPSQVAKLQEIMRTGKRVEVVYRQWAVSPPNIDTDYVVVEVKPL